MLRNLYTKALRDQRVAFLSWALGIGLYTLFSVALYPSIRGQQELEELFQDLPPAVAALVGAEGGDILSPEGFLGSRLFALLLPLLVLIYATTIGAGAIAGEEENGTLELLLANPIGRRRLVLERFAAMLTVIAALGVLVWLLLLISAPPFEIDIAAGRMAAIVTALALLGVVFGALALAVGCIIGRRSIVFGVAAVAGLAGYFADTLAPLSDRLDPLKRLSPFYYYDANDPLRNGLDPAHVAVLVGLTAALLVVAVVSFERRDVT